MCFMSEGAIIVFDNYKAVGTFYGGGEERRKRDGERERAKIAGISTEWGL